ncbi:hypothetical protein V493_01834 [Pseudogymnoascus sp. VKM F-4281 (FW-2241)]|nr:hypothetical protein V493_01834 [Pseudogymnoascus sp. VKM F-4281 (FW-2241)]
MSGCHKGAKNSACSKESSKVRPVKTAEEKAQDDDWNEAKKRKRIQNLLAQRTFRLKAKEAHESRHRNAENQLHAGNSYTIPDFDNLGLEPELSGLPWGGLSMQYIVNRGKATKGGSNMPAYLNSFQGTPNSGSSFRPAPPLVPGQQYQFAFEQRQQAKNTADEISQLPVALPPIESSNGEYAIDALELENPAKSNANSGTYTCTYHGCTLRFDTVTKLKLHKRDRHRPSAPLICGVAAALRDSQAGPHKCERINPSTDKPCNAIFSRPYDLTRHEDTTHNAWKEEVHCQFCTVILSRIDALPRHMRMVHPEIVHPEIDVPDMTRAPKGESTLIKNQRKRDS